jgi:hypothetical protein
MYRRGRAVAQAVSCWLPTAAARVRVRAAYGVCGGQSGTAADFTRFLHHHGSHSRSIGGRSSEWTQLDSTPHCTN